MRQTVKVESLSADEWLARAKEQDGHANASRLAALALSAESDACLCPPDGQTPDPLRASILDDAAHRETLAWCGAEWRAKRYRARASKILASQ